MHALRLKFKIKQARALYPVLYLCGGGGHAEDLIDISDYLWRAGNNRMQAFK